MSKILALSSVGLEINTFDTKEMKNVLLPAQIYKLKKETLVIGNEKKIIIYKFNEKLEKEFETDVGNIRKIEINNVIGVLLYTKELLIFAKSKDLSKKYEKTKQFENVNDFRISKNYIFLQVNRDLTIFENTNITEKLKITGVKSLFISDCQNNIFVIHVGQKVLIYKNLNKIMEHTFSEINSVKVKISPKGNFVLCLCNSITNESSSYYGFKELFMFNLLEKKFQKLDIDLPVAFEFINGGYSVCYAKQPAYVSTFDYTNKIMKKFPRGQRNRIYFNTHQNIVCFAGFDNISGMIEIYDAQTCKIISSIKMLGASLINWSPCGTYFFVAITNELKVANQIVVYDYFGRKIHKKDFENLISCEWIGEKSKFTMLERPKELNIFKEDSYVPPSLDTLKKKNKK